MAPIAALTPHAMPRLRSTPAARRRFGLALCASALTHAWLLTSLPPTQQPQVRPSFTINARIEAREMGPDSHIARNIGPSLAPFLTRLAPSLDPSLESIPVLEAAPDREKREACGVGDYCAAKSESGSSSGADPSSGARPGGAAATRRFDLVHGARARFLSPSARSHQARPIPDWGDRATPARGYCCGSVSMNTARSSRSVRERLPSPAIGWRPRARASERSGSRPRAKMSVR